MIGTLEKPIRAKLSSHTIVEETKPRLGLVCRALFKGEALD
jgi:hypothetical protein